MSAEPAPVLFLDSVDSTNAEAQRRAAAGEAGPVWIAAAEQTAGKGRRGRDWSTQPGALAATYLTTTAQPPGEVAQLSFVAALAAADLAGAYVDPQKVRLKWPNDVLIDGRKVAGILVETGRGPAGPWAAVGVGVNLAVAPDVAERPAAALADFMDGPPPNPAEALQVLAAAFARWRARWEEGGFLAIREAWTERAHGLGRPCVARLDKETVEGVAEGLEPDGALRLRLPSGQIRPIAAGDVFFQGAA